MRTLELSHIGAVYIACGYSDLRKGINGLVAQVQQQFRLDARAQAVFLFCGKRSDRFKALFGTETDSFCCTSVWKTDDTNGHGAVRKCSGSLSNNTVGSWRG